MSIIYFGCSTAKEEKNMPVKKEEKVPPGQARIVGEIVKIEPVIYERFFAGIFSPEEVYFKLRVIK